MANHQNCYTIIDLTVTKGKTMEVLFRKKYCGSLNVLQIKWKKQSYRFRCNFFFTCNVVQKALQTLSGKFVLTFIRPWNKFENEYTEKCGRLFKIGILIVVKNDLLESTFNLMFTLRVRTYLENWHFRFFFQRGIFFFKLTLGRKHKYA